MVALPSTYLYYAESCPALEHTRLTPLDFDYVIHVPLDGWIELRTENGSVRRGSGGAVIVSPTDRLSLTTSDGCRRLALRVRSQALATHLAAMLGDLPRERLVFAADSDSSQVSGRRLVNAVSYVAQEYERKDAINSHDLVVAQFEQFVMTLLLMSQPNNYSEALNRRDNGVRPTDVKRAIDYIDANLGRAISLEDLVAASGVPGRDAASALPGLCRHLPDGIHQEAALPAGPR